MIKEKIMINKKSAVTNLAYILVSAFLAIHINNAFASEISCAGCALNQRTCLKSCDLIKPGPVEDKCIEDCAKENSKCLKNCQ